jgi:hypothetical protein
MLNVFGSGVKSALENSVKNDREQFFNIQRKRDQAHAEEAIALLQLCIHNHTSIPSTMVTVSAAAKIKRDNMASSINIKEEVQVCPVDLTNDESDDEGRQREVSSEDESGSE